ncbi:Cytoskeleton-associated protein 5 [Holothuria leucospilota]|uniref:Cytoskeleton-associated protein 5 n=1 Tax=Holothuria leucospilota TaxID=206669 RepID=A0A9Q0YJE5_HOLLE|nr:Cytoskeleton-associated protein 5 [Holothuria leucospilota]
MGDEEWRKLSVEDQCVNKVWKARLNGYEEAVKLFKKLGNEKSPEYSKYAGLLKKFALDSNAVAQEKGLDAILAFQENAALAPKTCGEVSSAVVTKCLNSARAKTKEKGKEILMMYIELEKQEQVMEEVMNGLSNKQPKIVAACTLVIKEAVRDFGSKVINVKPIVKAIPKLLEHSDKTVREEAKQLAVEVFRWIGPAIKPSLQNIKPVQLKELEDEFEKLPKKPPKQARFLKSQQDLKAKAEAAGGGDDDESGSEEEEDAAPAVDPFDLLEPEEILSKLPKDFYESMEAKKWQTRKAALETIQPLCCKPKLEAGDYADLVKVLKKTISKDTNVMIVAVAGKCLAGLGNGLKKKFSPYAALCIQAILEKFKEKKVMVVTALREAIDAVFPSTNFTNIMEDVLAALDNKNPSIKSETCLFLARSFRVSSSSSLAPKTALKPLCQSLVQKLSDTTPDVREAAMQALGTALRIVGEKPLNPFILDLEKIKLDKIKEYCEKVELPEGKGGAKKPKAKEKKEEKPEAPASSSSRPKTAPPSAGTEKKSVKGGKTTKPGGAAKPPPKAVKGGGGAKKVASKKSGGAKSEKEVASEATLTDEEVVEKASALLSKEIIDQLASTKWKERLEAMEELTKKVHNMERAEIPCQVFVRFLARGSGFKDANFNVLNLKFAMIAILAEKSNFTRTSAGFVYKPIVDKIGDIKVGAKAKEALTAIGEAVTLGFIAEHVIKYAFEGQKNPKNQAESFNWFSQAIQEFGFATINAKPFINHIKVALSAVNPQVRTAAVTCIGIMYMYMGANLRMLFEDLKPALLSQIDAEIEKVSDTKPPKPFRGLKKGGGGDAESDEEDDDEDDDAGEDGAAGGGMNMQDMVPREDISGKITDGLLTELGDAKWKIRGEALEKVQTILKEAKFISPNLGELPTALKARLAESNKILATTTANICQTIATAMGPAVKTHVKTLIPGLLFLTADSKVTVRQAAVQALTAWEEQIGLAPFIEDETLSSALAKEKPQMKMEIFGWLAEKLLKYRTLPPDLSLCVPYLFSGLEDRNADVRKKSQEALPAFMMHLTYEKMVKMTGKLKPASKTQILGIMEKQRPNIPEKPGKPAKSGKKSKKEAKAEVVEDEEEEEPAPPPKKTSKRPKTAPSKSSSSSDSAPSSSVSNSSAPPEPSEGAPAASKKGKPKENAAQKKLSSKSGKKKDDDEDTGPPLLLVGSKEKRFKDEQDLKVLKWNFTAARSEYVDQLKEQMQPCFSKSLIHNMYQDDFKYHVQAITVLTNCIENHKEATIANLDLILKWFTLRFTETNTSVHVKSIDYLQQLFTMLAADDYSLSDVEANAFCPSLVAKVGDNKENIRKGVRKVMKLLMKLYPASKMFVFIMEGLKSKNARQRTECLEELTSMIEVYGLNVCQPSPPKALKEIATQIADRDNSVRSAALNALVQAYQIVGEDIYKQVGKLNDKDLALLEERIKRSGKKPAIANKSAQPVQNKKNDKANRADNKKSALLTTRPATAPEQAPQTNSSSTPAYFSLDLDKLDLEKPASSVTLPALEDTSVADELLDAEIKIPTRSIPKPSMPTEMQLNFMMSQVASNDLNLSIQSLAQLDEILKDRDRSKVMISHVDQLLVATAFQLRMAFSKHMGDEESSKNVIRMYRCLVALLVSLFQNCQLSKEASKDVLCDLVNGLITVLIDDRLMKFEDGPQVVRSVNVLMAKVVENSDHSNIIGALLKLLHECVATESHSPKFLQLVMKCLWRMVRLMPNIINDIVVEKILLDMHNFLKAFPSSVWKERPSDTPLRTVKTMLHSLAKILGPKVLTYLSAIPDPQESEVEVYLKKVLKSSQRSASFNSNEQLNNGSTSESEKNHPQGGERNTPRRPSAKTNDILAEIFKKIGSKENTREGLAELYDFKQKYPDVNIDPFLKKTSQFFQTYIEHGLKTITLERESAHSKIPPSDQTSVITPGSDSGHSLDGKTESGDMSNYLERIRVLRAKCGFENNPEDATSAGSKHAGKTGSGPAFPDSNKESNPTNTHPGLYQPSRITLGSSSSLIPSQTAPSAPDNNMEDLKKRLERIKREQKK